MYAVIALQGHQYIDQEGDELVVDQLEGKEGDSVTIDTVLLAFDEAGKDVKVGAPQVSGASVKAKIVDHKRGKKVKVFKFQGKKRYHKTRGFKPHQTILSIEKISL